MRSSILAGRVRNMWSPCAILVPTAPLASASSENSWSLSQEGDEPGCLLVTCPLEPEVRGRGELCRQAGPEPRVRKGTWWQKQGWKHARASAVALMTQKTFQFCREDSSRHKASEAVRRLSQDASVSVVLVLTGASLSSPASGSFTLDTPKEDHVAGVGGEYRTEQQRE